MSNPAEERNLLILLTEKEAGLMQAQKSLSSISANRDLWIAQYRQELFDRDMRSGINAARREGKLEGIREGKLETARRLLKMGLSVQQVAEGSGLPVAEIEKLQLSASQVC